MKSQDQKLTTSESVLKWLPDRPFFWFVCSLLLALVLLYLPWLRSQASFFISDHSLFFEPLCRYVADRLSRGSFPLWNPLLGGGQSQVAIASPSLFYPPHLLFCVLPYSTSVALQMIFHQLLLGAGIYLIIERLEWGKLAATAGGATVALSGYVFALSQNFTIVDTAAWAPWCILAVLLLDSPMSRQQTAGCLMMAVSFYMMMASGRPEIWMVTCLLILTLCSLVIWKNFRRRQNFYPKLVLVTGSIISALLIAMPVILPPGEWALHSPRSVAALNTDTFLFSGSWYDLLSVVLGQPLGSIFDFQNPYVPLLKTDGHLLPFVVNDFLGPVVLTLVLVGISDRRWRYRWLVLGLCLAAVVVAMGKNTPIMPFLIERAKLLSFLRSPIKFMFFVHVALAFMAARGVYFLSGQSLDGLERKRLATRLFCFWIACIFCGVLMWVAPQWTWFGMARFFSNYVHQSAASAIKTIGIQLSVWSLAGLAVVWLLAYSSRKPASNSMAVQATVLLAILGLLLGAWTGNLNLDHLSDPQFYDHHSFAADVINEASRKQAVPPRVLVMIPEPPVVPNDYHEPRQLFNLNASQQYGRQILRENTNLDFNIGSLFAYEGSVSRENRLLETLFKGNIVPGTVSDLSIARVCQATSTDFLITQSDQKLPIPPPTERYFKIIGKQMGICVYATRDPLPFAYFASRYVWLPTGAAIEAMSTAQSSGFDPHQEVLLSRDSGIVSLPTSAVIIADKSGSSTVNCIKAVTLTAVTPERIEVDVETPVKGALVVSDQLYPGWRAYVDNVEVPMVRANGLFKAVFLTPGRHHALLLFQPWSLQLGLELAALGVFMLLALVVIVCRNVSILPTQADR